MIRVLYVLIATFLVLNTSQTAPHDAEAFLQSNEPFGGADDSLFNPSFSNMVGGASAFVTAFINYGAFQACASDPSCGMPDDPGSGFEVGAGSCCDNNDDCFNEFGTHVNRLDRALLTLYTNERHYNLVMRIQGVRMAAMRGAGSMSAMGAAVVARQEVDIAIAEKGFLEKFNAKANSNISSLNDFLLELGALIENYCEGSNWYQRNGLPLYLHAKMKFPK